MTETAAILYEIHWLKNPRIRAHARTLNLTLSQVESFARQEADGLAVWAHWVPGVLESLDPVLGKLPRASGNLRVNINAAIAADFTPTI